MSLTLLFALPFALQAHSYALPNPQAAAVTTAPTGTLSADLSDVTDFSTLPESYYAAFTSGLSNYSVGSAELASESAAYASWTKQFYATVAPSDLAAISSYNRAESEAYASWTSNLYETLGTSDYNALTSEYAQWTKEEAVYATYTGTGIPYISGLTNGSTTYSVPAQVTPNGVVRGTGSSTGAVVAQQTFAPLTRSQSTPNSYALTCLDSTASQMDNHAVSSADCTQTAQDICDSLTNPVTVVKDQWVWSKKGGNCAMGYWLPSVGAGIAAVPSSQECQANIYGMMTRTCIPVVDSNAKWNAASVNVVVLPSADSSGQQVDSGKISFLMAGSPYPCGQAGCKMTSDS